MLISRFLPHSSHTCQSFRRLGTAAEESKPDEHLGEVLLQYATLPLCPVPILDDLVCVCAVYKARQYRISKYYSTDLH